MPAGRRRSTPMRTRTRAAERGQAPNIAEWHVFVVSDMVSEPDDPPGIKVELGARHSGGLFGVVLGGVDPEFGVHLRRARGQVRARASAGLRLAARGPSAVQRDGRVAVDGRGAPPGDGPRPGAQQALIFQ
jgi:hypothetical protein